MTIPLPQLLFPDPFSPPPAWKHSHTSYTLPSTQPLANHTPISCCSSYGAHSHMAHHDSPHSSGSSLTSRANSGTEAQSQDLPNTLTKKSSLKRKRDSKPNADLPPLEGTLKTTREAPKKKKANRGKCPTDCLVHILMAHCAQLAFTVKRHILPATIHGLVNVA
jgi:hypothetical protein